MNQKIVFFGSDNFTIPVVQKLLNHGLELVVTNKNNTELTKFCEEKYIPYVVSNLKDEEVKVRIKNVNAPLAILASYGAIIPESIINSFKMGIINIHPSLLPKYKGPTPVQTTLLNGDTQTGVSLILLDKEVDHGPLLVQKPYTLQGNETSEDLLSILFEIGADMVDAVITDMENGIDHTGSPQDHSQESWSHMIKKGDGRIDLNKIPLEIGNWKLEIDRKIRAYYPWPGVWFVCHPELVSGSKSLSNKIIKLLPEGRIQVEGKKPISYKDFINGFGEEGRELLQKLNLL